MSLEKFTVSARGSISLEVDVNDLFDSWRRWIDSQVAKNRKVECTYAAFCAWADEAVAEDVVERAIDCVFFDIENGPLAEDLLTREAFIALVDGTADEGEKPPVPGKGQLDVFGGEVK